MGKTKIDHYFQEIQQRNENLFVPYIVAGDGGLETLNDRIQFLEESGAAAIELGIPFSDPVADGPTIQEASIRALEHGTSLRKVLDTIAPKKEHRHVPIVLMTYINPIFSYGVEQFAADCKRVGVDGIIVPDIPMEEEELIAPSLAANDIAYIRLAALTSTEDRLKKIAAKSEGFLYAVSVTGTTGERANHDARVSDYLQTLKKFSNVPVLAGFGVANAIQAKELSSHGDGVIVGSKIVQLFHEEKATEVRTLIQESLPKKQRLTN